ncbi:MAG: ABC transporter ATP-binding protein [Caldilineaceae bacterium]
MAFLELNNIRKEFGRFVAVEAFNLQVERGEFVSFLGPSGCGKTTTLRMIAGFELPTAGQITMDGKEITYTRPNARNIGMVFQSYALFPNMTVAGNIGFGLKVAGKAAAEIKERVAEMLHLIGLADLGDRYPYQLSGGQQQRVALARALAIRPQLLLLDEPLSALDAKIRVNLRNEIRSIQRQLGITTIYVTHDQEEALSLSDRIVVMSAGRMEQVGSPFAIYNFPQTRFVASFVGTLNIVPATVVNGAQGEVQIDGQQITLAAGIDGATNGAQVTVALRPEALSLTESGANRLVGHVENIAFLGSIVRIYIRLNETLLSLDEFNNPHLTLPTVGAAITIYFPPEAGLILP